MRFRDLKKQSNKNNQTNKPANVQASAYYIYRIKALIVDLFMIYMPIMYIMTYGFLDGKDDLAASTLAPLIATGLYGLIYAVFLSKTGQTPGKKAYDIQVVDAKTHQNIVIFRAFFRFITFLFTVTTVLGLFLPLIRKDKRTLHDILAGTAVRHLESK